jgi:glycerophosphoryl diester phosphodiesterase
MQAIRRPPIGFAHRGARAHAPENTLEAFRLALKLGATGLESDVWLTADGVPVLDHDGVAGRGLRRRRLSGLRRDQLPPSIPTLAELYEDCGADYELSLDVKDPEAVHAVLAVAASAGATERLWLCDGVVDRLESWRALDERVHLVDSTRIRRIADGPERRAARLAAGGVDAINLHASDWTAGLTTLFHRFERLAFAWDAQQAHTLGLVLDMGVDAVYSDHVDRMVAALSHLSR